VLASSLDLASTMRQFVELLVPGYADLCVIDLVGETGAIEGLAAAASRTGLADELGTCGDASRSTAAESIRSRA